MGLGTSGLPAGRVSCARPSMHAGRYALGTHDGKKSLGGHSDEVTSCFGVEQVTPRRTNCQRTAPTRSFQVEGRVANVRCLARRDSEKIARPKNSIRFGFRSGHGVASNDDREEVQEPRGGQELHRGGGTRAGKDGQRKGGGKQSNEEISDSVVQKDLVLVLFQESQVGAFLVDRRRTPEQVPQDPGRRSEGVGGDDLRRGIARSPSGDHDVVIRRRDARSGVKERPVHVEDDGQDLVSGSFVHNRTVVPGDLSVARSGRSSMYAHNAGLAGHSSRSDSSAGVVQKKSSSSSVFRRPH